MLSLGWARAPARAQAIETEVCPGASQVVNPLHVRLIFNAYPHPNVGCPREFAITFKQASRAFGTRLELMLVCLVHHRKHPPNVFHRHGG